MPDTILVDGREFVLGVPSPETPGYMRRMMRYAELSDALAQGFSSATMTAFVDFLAGYITPADGGDAREALLDLSEKGLEVIQEAVQGRAPAPKGESSSPS